MMVRECKQLLGRPVGATGGYLQWPLWLADAQVDATVGGDEWRTSLVMAGFPRGGNDYLRIWRRSQNG